MAFCIPSKMEYKLPGIKGYLSATAKEQDCG